MSKFLTQKKIIIGLLLFSLFLVLIFSFKTDWLKKPVFLDTLSENLIQKLNKTSRALAQEYAPYFFPHFPQRLIYVLEEGEILIEELVELNEELNDQLKKSDCRLAISECLPKITFGGVGCTPAGVLGSPLSNLGKVEENKEEISDRIDNLSYLRELLEKEMAGGLPKELETLRPELAEELKNRLEEVFKKSGEIISIAKENKELYSKDYTKNCIASCKPGPVCGIKACAMLGTGPQRHIEIKAKLGVSLDDLDLGKIGIDTFGLALPDKLKFPQLGDIVITVPPQTLQICFPFKPITIRFDPPSFVTLPTLSFTCPKLPTFKDIEFKIPKLPKEIKIPFPKIPEIKWCPDIPEIPLMEELEKIRQELIAAAEKEVEKFKSKIDESINQINQALEGATGEIKEKLEKQKEDLLKEHEKVKKEIPEEVVTPPIEFEAEQASKEYEYKSPESKGLEIEDISLSYQCGQTAGDETVETGAGTNWYFEILRWLMEQCANLPTMSSQWGLKTKAANCYDPEKVIETIVNECDAIWQTYDPGFSPTPPPICLTLGKPCLGKEQAKERECKNLFNQEKEPIPSTCYLKILDCELCACDGTENQYTTLDSIKKVVETLENKCQGLKAQGRKEPPQPCKVLPLFTGELEPPDSETYSGSKTSCPAQKLLNLPFGFGGGIGFNCPIGLPSLPKIVLPDIIFPDIILPDFRVPPFLRVKLPSIIIEDIILPDIDLCDLNDCSNIFPSLNFKLPQLNLPSLDLSVPIPQLPGLQLRGGVDFPQINLALPQINLFNLLLPELILPEIPLPSPKINFAITGIDVSAIFDLIFTFILNALDVPDFGYCLTFKIPTTFLSIVFPDYYFSFLKFPEIPEIDFCKDVNEFCRKVKNALGEGGWLNKAKEIETEFNKTIDQIQKELDKVSEAVEDIQDVIDEIFKDIYGKAIYDAIVKQLAKEGLSLEDYMDPKTKEIDLTKVPFPGVFPVKTVDERECLPVSTPQVDIILRIVDKADFPEKKVEKKDNQFIIYVPVDIPLEIPIPWPEELKKINLINPLGYDLPDIPLSGLSYEKEFPIKGPGFQPRTFTFDFGRANEGDCLSKPPQGGNPVPIGQITVKINEIKSIKSETDSASQVIIEILE